MWKNRLLTVLLLALIPVAVACGNDGNASGNADRETVSERPARGMAWVIFGNDTVHAEVAESPAERERGLMHRTELASGDGMLFIFDEQETLSFWMQNTFIPLDIAYLDRRQVVVDIQPMEPESEEFVESRSPAQFAVEVPQGWFAEHGIEVGTQARIVRGR